MIPINPVEFRKTVKGFRKFHLLLLNIMGIMLFSEYKNQVILAYKRLRDQDDLPFNLKKPTPAQLKQELLYVLVDENTYLEKDIDIVRAFFGPKNDLTEYSKAIKKFGTDKCKPLNIFLKTLEHDAEEGNTDDKNINLLAILINFRPRPYVYGVTKIEDLISPDPNNGNINRIGKGNESQGQPDSKANNDEKGNNDDKPDGNKNERNFWFQKLVLTTGIIALVGGGAYLSTGQTKVFICDHGTGKKYHLNLNCPSLKNCKNGVVKTIMTEAEKNGKTLCDWEQHKPL